MYVLNIRYILYVCACITSLWMGKHTLFVHMVYVLYIYMYIHTLCIIYIRMQCCVSNARTHSFWATQMYFSDRWLTLSSKISRNACLSPAVDTAHVALATVSCSPNVCLGKDIPGCTPISSISTTALYIGRTWHCNCVQFLQQNQYIICIVLCRNFYCRIICV